MTQDVIKSAALINSSRVITQENLKSSLEIVIKELRLSSLCDQLTIVDISQARQSDGNGFAEILDPKSGHDSALDDFEVVLIAIDHGIDAVAAMLRQQEAMSTETAVYCWLSETKALLDIRKAQRKRIQFVNLNALVEKPALDIYQQTAELLLTQQREFSAMVGHLEASCSYSAQRPILDLDSLLNQHQQQALLKDHESASNQKKLNTLEQEKAEVFAQLLITQESLENLHLTEKKKIEELEVSLKKARETIESGNRSSEEQVTKLEKSLQHTQEKLEIALTEKKKTKELEVSLKKARETIESGKRSSEEQVTKLEKSLQHTQEKLEIALTDKKSLQQEMQSCQERLKAQEVESALLLDQLLTVQESLEQSYFEQQALLFKLHPMLDKAVELDEEYVANIDSNLLVIARSEFFNALWYITEYPDIGSAGINPAEHYLHSGYAEQRIPSPIFDGNWYLAQHADVAAAGLNPLLHYELHGRDEGRAAKFDTSDDTSVQK